MKKNRIRRALCTILLLLIIPISIVKYTKNEQITYTTYIVHPGDTLWSIAQTYHKDTRKIVYIIRKKNNISPNIYPGQEILIPAKEGE